MTHLEIDKYMNILADNVKRISQNDIMELADKDPVTTFNKLHERFRQVESSNLYSINERRHHEPFTGLTKKLLRADFSSADLFVWRDYLKDDDNYYIFSDGAWLNHDDSVKRQILNIDAASKQYGWSPDDTKCIQSEYYSIILAIDQDWQDLLSIFGSGFENVKYSHELLDLFLNHESLLYEFINECNKQKDNLHFIIYKYKSYGNNVRSLTDERKGKTLYTELQKLGIVEKTYDTFKYHVLKVYEKH
jgi:hypothetical protein